MFPRMIALDIDGTLFDSKGQISARTPDAIRECMSNGIEVVLATGRDYDALPLDEALSAGIRYAVTTNGSAIYELGSRRCIQEQCMERAEVLQILAYTDARDVFPYLFIDGVGYTAEDKVPVFERVDWPRHLIEETMRNMHVVPDLTAFVAASRRGVQKGAILFPGPMGAATGSWDEAEQFLNAFPHVHAVNGGVANLEFNHAEATKAAGLARLAQMLGCTMADVLAIGDSENDLEMLHAAGTGVAMGNAPESVKRVADCVTLTNEEEGVCVILREVLQRFVDAGL